MVYASSVAPPLPPFPAAIHTHTASRQGAESGRRRLNITAAASVRLVVVRRWTSGVSTDNGWGGGGIDWKGKWRKMVR